MTGPILGGAGITAAAALAGSRSFANGQPAPVPLSPERAAFMRGHFASVMQVHEAVVRGDLETARREARRIGEQAAPASIPPSAALDFKNMQMTARRIAGDTELEDIAASTAAMLAKCGDCHRTVGTMPAVALPVFPSVGGVVGHMLTHRAAVDLMVQGLAIPSTSAWNQGAEALKTAPLHPKAFPAGSKLSSDMRALEQRVHSLAERGLQATDQRSRIFVYSEVLQSAAPATRYIRTYARPTGPESSGARPGGTMSRVARRRRYQRCSVKHATRGIFPRPFDVFRGGRHGQCLKVAASQSPRSGFRVRRGGRIVAATWARRR